MLQVDIRTLDALAVAAVRHEGAYNAIGEAFQALYDWAGPRGYLGEGTRTLGLYWDDPRRTAEPELRSAACVTLPDGVVPAGYVKPLTIDGGRYAVVVHKGAYEKLAQVYAWLLDEWLPASGEALAADRPFIEEYLNDPAQFLPEHWLTEIYMPLKG